jgi:cell division transport system ATP-binding protein
MMVQCLQLSKTYRSNVPVFRDTNFQVARGALIFLVGKSGSGKSTLFRLLLGMEPPDQGNILIDGKKINGLSPDELPRFRRCTGVVFQDMKLLKHRSVFENAALPLEIQRRTDAFIQRRVYRTLRRAGLEGKEEVLCNDLCAGEQQRVALARALVHDPALLLVDEPGSHLDEGGLRSALELFQEARAQGATVIIATRDTSLPSRVPDNRTVTIQEGRIVDVARTV